MPCYSVEIHSLLCALAIIVHIVTIHYVFFLFKSPFYGQTDDLNVSELQFDREGGSQIDHDMSYIIFFIIHCL